MSQPSATRARDASGAGSENRIHDTIEEVATTAYGRLVAYLAFRTRDVQAAEDAVSEAVVQALRTWPRDGIPERPEAWLAVAASHRVIDAGRKQVRERELLAAFDDASPENVMNVTGNETTGDERLDLMLACTHPALDSDRSGRAGAAAIAAPLMMQCVLGLTAAQIAPLLMVSPATLTRRLSRAKQTLRSEVLPAALIDRGGDSPFNNSRANDLQRLPAVLDAIAATFTLGWELVGDPDIATGTTARDAIRLAEAVVISRPDHAEARGLLAMMQFSHARRAARRDEAGCYVPLGDQDVSRWDAGLIATAEAHLKRAAARRQPGPFQTLAAIQSVHCDRLRTDGTNWHAVIALYDHAVAIAPTLGTRIARAAAVLSAGDAAAALRALDALPADDIASSQPYWATRARVLNALHAPEADAARRIAIGLTTDPAVRTFLRRPTGSRAN